MVKTMVKPRVSGQNRFSRENHPQVQRRAQLDHRRLAPWQTIKVVTFKGPAMMFVGLFVGYYMVIIWLIMVNNG